LKAPYIIALSEVDIIPSTFGTVNIWTRLGHGESARYFEPIPAGTLVKVVFESTRWGKAQWKFYDIPTDPDQPPSAVRVIQPPPPDGAHIMHECDSLLIVRTPRSVLERALFLLRSADGEEGKIAAFAACRSFLIHLYLNDMAGEEVARLIEKAEKCLRLALDGIR